MQEALITEAVMLVEESGPLDDAQALRQAMQLHNDPAGRIAERARLLGQRIGLQAELARGRAGAPWVLLALVALIVIAGLSLAGNVIGGGQRQINVVLALTSLLGLHLLSLLLWLAGLLLPRASFQASLGWLWLRLTARLASGRHGQAALLLRASSRLLVRARLLPWALGFVSHVIWALSFTVVLAALLFALAFRNYTLIWETTILDPAFFVRSVQLLGQAPAWLGFPLPDSQAVLSPLAAASGQRAWALWLTGCILVYGLLPRLVFALWSAIVWVARKKALQPALGEAYFQRLLARFNALEARQIVDPDPGRGSCIPAAQRASQDSSDTLIAVGFELRPEQPWPPFTLEPKRPHTRTLRVDGSAQQQRELFDTLARVRPGHLLIGCRAAASPDRGTERFLRELMRLGGECRLWLVADASDAAARLRWQAWLVDSGLGQLAQFALADTPEAVLHGWT